MPWAAAAAVAGAVITSSSAKKASNSAANAQTDAANQANATQQEQYQQTRSDQEPWRVAGMQGLDQLQSGIGTGGQFTKNFGAGDFQQDPGYQFRMDEGMRGMSNSAAARGGVLSGAALKAASRYSQNFASNEYGNAYNRFETNKTNNFNRLASIAGVGQTANNALSQAGSNMANNVSQNQLGAGNARASGYVGGANALSGGLSQGFNMYQSQQLMNKIGGNNGANRNPINWFGQNSGGSDGYTLPNGESTGS